jgi:hypothetical protein
VMTAVNTESYATVWFSPKLTFRNVSNLGSKHHRSRRRQLDRCQSPARFLDGDIRVQFGDGNHNPDDTSTQGERRQIRLVCKLGVGTTPRCTH